MNMGLEVEQRLIMDELRLSHDSTNNPIFSGDEEIFAFERALSRLYEMQTLKYIQESKRTRGYEE